MNDSLSISPLLRLPDELLHSILYHVDLHTLVACQLSCKRLLDVGSDPLQWRRQCLSEYRYWSPPCNPRTLSQAPVIGIGWRDLIVARKLQDRLISDSVDSLLENQACRLEKIQSIADHGYDAKEILFKQTDVPHDVGDGLARAYWCNEALGCIERSSALSEWSKLADGEDVPLENALVAFDLFVAERPPMDFNAISAYLDSLAQDYYQTKDTVQHTEELSPRQRAQDIAQYCRGINLVGLPPEYNYYVLQNNLISMALCDPQHPSLQLISVAIFCCVARRCGLDARTCSFPGHVLAVVYPPNGKTLDGVDVSNEPREQWMYLDPFNTHHEIPVTSLRTSLVRYGLTSTAAQEEYLRPSSTADMVRRVATNLLHIPRRPGAPKGNYFPALASVCPTVLPYLQPSTTNPVDFATTLNYPRARYAAHWIELLFPNIDPTADAETRHRALIHPFSNLLREFNQFNPCDLALLSRFVVPLFAAGTGEAEQQMREVISELVANYRRDDAEVQAPKPREAGGGAMRFSIGQVFRHRRYGYLGAITGWDEECRQSETWISQMNVNSLERGQWQPFYDVMADDATQRYVAEENIVLLGRGDKADVEQQVGPAQQGTEMMELSQRGSGPWRMPEAFRREAGKWFKRWDPIEGRFVSNMKDLYPDD